MSGTIDNKRIARNTAVLYARMFLLMAISLYTSRIVLQTLGVADFGIYNVIGGIVVLFTFVNSAMVTATQRFINYELGRGYEAVVRRLFSMSLTTHLFIASVVALAGETVGLWFMEQYVRIPEGRMVAALWVYHFSVAATAVSIVRAPYNAAIVAYERMSAFAYISLVEAVMKLLVVFLLVFVSADKLEMFAVLQLAVVVIISLCYKLYANRHIAASRYRPFWDGALIRRLLGFSGWSLFGSAASLGVKQGMNILQNLFFGVGMNAAMGVAGQVNTAVWNFSANFQTSFNPEYAKAEAVGVSDVFFAVCYLTGKFSFLLLLVLSLPLAACMDQVLSIWLTEVPPHATAFCLLMLCTSLVEGITAPLWMVVQATGRIRNYQMTVSILIALTLPVSYILLKCGAQPEAVLGTQLGINLFVYAYRVSYLRHAIGLPLRGYTRGVLFPCAGVLGVSLIMTALATMAGDGWVGTLLTMATAVSAVGISAFYIGLNRQERHFILSMLKIKRNDNGSR